MSYLEAADQLLYTVPPGTQGVWPRACAWLLRLELEAAMDDYWSRLAPDVGRGRAQAPKLLLLSHRAGPALGRRVSYLWWALSRAGHHHAYELGITLVELTALRTELMALTALLRNAAGLPPAAQEGRT